MLLEFSSITLNLSQFHPISVLYWHSNKQYCNKIAYYYTYWYKHYHPKYTNCAQETFYILKTDTDYLCMLMFLKHVLFSL